MLAVSNGLLAAGIVLDLLISIVVGLVPLFYGRMRGKRTLGIAGFAATVIVGLVLGFVIAIVVALVFLLVIWATTRGRTPRTSLTV